MDKTSSQILEITLVCQNFLTPTEIYRLFRGKFLTGPWKLCTERMFKGSEHHSFSNSEGLSEFLEYNPPDVLPFISESTSLSDVDFKLPLSNGTEGSDLSENSQYRL